MPLPEPEFLRFMELLAPDGPHREVECGRFLIHATTLLFPSFPNVDFEIAWEERMFFGESDFIVVGSFKNSFGHLERRAYIWELKAPQCFVFQRDGSNTRVRPTTDLIKAETQLIHYAAEARGNEIFHRRYNVHPSGVYLGGIIIGRDGRMWDPEETRLNANAAQLSCELREAALYGPARLQMHTWDRVADVLRPEPKREMP